VVKKLQERSGMPGQALASWVQHTVQHTVENLERRNQEQLAAVFHELDRNGDACISMAELGHNAPGLVTARSIVMAAGVPAHRLAAALAGATAVRWCLSWFVLLLCVQLLLCAAEWTRVFLSLDRGGRKPFEQPPSAMRRASTEVALHYDTPVGGSGYERLKMLLMLLSGLSSLRLTMAFISFASGVLLLNLAARVGRSASLGPSLREPIVTLALGLARLSIWWIGYFHVEAIGHVAPSHEARIIVSNHVGLIEVLLLYGAARCPSFVTRIENISLPLFAGLVHVSRAIVVDRELRTSRERTLREIGERAHDTLGPQLMVFPEGTCNNQHSLFRFNRGAFAPGVPVQPVVYHFPYVNFNPCLTGEATGGHELPGVFWRTACQLVNRVEVKFLPVYKPSEAERTDPLLYATNVQALMASHLHVPVTDATLSDYKALAIRHHLAVPNGVPPHGRGSHGVSMSHSLHSVTVPDSHSRSLSPSAMSRRGSSCISPGAVEAGRGVAISVKAE
jgi:1-acyl-sn-glycerol-3-phosphate acyltransferase